MNYRALYKKIIDIIDVDNVDNIERLWKTEIGQTFSDYYKAAEFTVRLMEKTGLSEVKKVSFPADGKTVYHDKISPLAWDATIGKMTILKSPIPIEDAIVADYSRHPFHIIKGSVSTPPGGKNVCLITQEQLFCGHDAQDAMVILNPETLPRHEILKYILDCGALGLVNTSLIDRYLTPDGICWVNACTEGPQWHVQSEDRPFIGFSVSPRTGDILLSAARKGEVIANVQCDGRRHRGKVDVVTGIIPGREKKEVWLIGHLYEPMPDDNSLGVIAGISIAKNLKYLFDSGILPSPRFTLRLIFGLEMYGFAAYADSQGPNLGDKVICAINLDGFEYKKKGTVEYWLSPQGSPFFGNYLIEEMVENIPTKTLPDVNFVIKKEGAYFDDMFLADSTTAVPVVWPLANMNLHHNSDQTMKRLEASVISQYIAFQSVLAARIITAGVHEDAEKLIKQAFEKAKQHLQDETAEITENLFKKENATISNIEEAKFKIEWSYEKEKKQIQDFKDIFPFSKIEKSLKILSRAKIELIQELEANIAKADKKCSNCISSKRTEVWWKIAETIVPVRNSTGLPYDLAMVPKEERKDLPDGCFYGPFARIMANMDGMKNLKSLILEAEWEAKQEISASKVREYIGAVEFLSEYNYLKNRYTLSIKKEDIRMALRKAGIRQGDLIMVHSGLSSFGHIEGGADTVIDAFLEVVGDKGTLLFPTFTMSFTCFNGDCSAIRNHRPFDIEDTSVWVGKIPSTFLKRKGVVRSSHPTHSVAGIGHLAGKCLLAHRASDPPVCRNSPFGKLMECNGKIAWFGAGLESTTFFHLLENELDMPYLKEAVCRVKEKTGAIRILLIQKHLPGHRDFYICPAEGTKMYKELLKKGLVIDKSNLGFGEIKVIDAKQMYELGMESLKKEPTLLLCDNPECIFCSKYKNTVKETFMRWKQP